jgi:molybdenum cofactor cytidylyltransferase
VLGAWQASQVGAVVLVTHPDDKEIAAIARACGAVVVQPQPPPPEMKDSVQAGLGHLEREYAPHDPDAWLLAPADMPGLTATLIDRVIDAYRASVAKGEPPAIWALDFGGRRGHPVVFPWSLAAEVARLAVDEGINAIVSRVGVRTARLDSLAEPEDFDTPADYDRLRMARGD